AVPRASGISPGREARTRFIKIYNAPARLKAPGLFELRALLRPRSRPHGGSVDPLALDETDDHQQYDRSTHGADDRADGAGQRHKSQLREQPQSDEGADDADDDVPDQPEPKAAHDLSGQPASDRTDDDHDDDAVYSVHDIPPPLGQARGAGATLRCS